MATREAYTMMFTGRDKAAFDAWLKRCHRLGAAEKMTEAVRLAIRLAMSLPDEQIKGSGKGA